MIRGLVLSVVVVLLLLLQSNSNASAPSEEYKTYIIQMDYESSSATLASFPSVEAWHKSVLKSLPSSPPDYDDNSDMLLYSYSHALHGFSAKLTDSQLSELEDSPAHVATYPDSFGRLFTTHTPKFLGLNDKVGVWPASSYGKDVIIGVIDTGIWPESESFSDKGMPRVPKRWKGACENRTSFASSLCNRKLIGARSFNKGFRASGRNLAALDYDSPRDYNGHGTHTSSTAAGNHVTSASHFGYAKGSPRGMAPRAHLAMYKIGWSGQELMASDVLAGMDRAISDGVDIMSLSFGLYITEYFNDVIAIASFSAVQRGIVVVCAVGNDGPLESSTSNGAPWITTVGAGTMDRTFTAKFTLDGGLFTAEGVSYFPLSVYISDAPLFYGKHNTSKQRCDPGALIREEVVSKVVLCDWSNLTSFVGQMTEVGNSGAYAGIFMSNESDFNLQDFTIPALVLPIEKGVLIKEYATRANKTTQVKTLSFVHTSLGSKPAPQVYSQSSRGPDRNNPSILKPDILAPGVDVLGAVAPNRPSIFHLNNYELVSDYALLSGTSMAAPHVAGVAALVKAVHREWSPAAIRSAIMTSAYTVDNTNATIKNQETGLPATPLDFGAGHINPNKAMNPGLIYDMDVQDYIEFLCGLGYNAKQMRAVLRRSEWSCSSNLTQLNYPSFIASFKSSIDRSSTKSENFTRVVTNVGNHTSIYKAVLQVPRGLKIAVEPSTLAFSRKNQQHAFSLRVEIDGNASRVTYGYLKWIDQHSHIVSSPVVIVNN
ncbi:unnamed protein product [Malus baccata var. baccata]